MGATNSGPKVVDLDPKTARAIAPLLGRVLILDSSPSSARMLADLLQNFGVGQVWTAATTRQGLTLADEGNPHLIFTEFACEGVDGIEFTQRIRRSGLPCRRAPVIMVTAQATPASIIAARDAGVHEFLRKPFTIKDLMRRLEAVTLRRRDWIEGINYIGPDRRRFNSGDYTGPLKRRVDHAETPDDARLVQALRILKAALAAVERDPRQALRAMLAQVNELGRVAKSKSDAKLRTATSALAAYLAGKDPPRLRAAELEPLMAELLTYLPPEEAAARFAAA